MERVRGRESISLLLGRPSGFMENAKRSVATIRALQSMTTDAATQDIQRSCGLALMNSTQPLNRWRTTRAERFRFEPLGLSI